MAVIAEPQASTPGPSSPGMKIRMLEQMAEALEDEANGLYKRAAAFEEEEFLLNREIGDRQTEINRLMLKQEAMRGERDRVMERIESISREAAAMREEIFNSEEEIALAGLENAQGALPADAAGNGAGDRQNAKFFRRMTVAEQIP